MNVFHGTVSFNNCLNMNNFVTSKQIQSVTTKLPARRDKGVYNFHVYRNKKKLPTSRCINKQNYFVLNYRVVSTVE